MSSLAPPERVWWKPLNREERLWVYLVVLWSLVLFAMMIIWSAVGRQDTPVETYKVTPQQFLDKTNSFIQKYQVGTEQGVPVVRPPEGGEAYMLGRAFQWVPILELKKGHTYRIHLSSQDVQHGFSLQPVNMNFQALPGYDYVVQLTPDQAGEFYIICNEYCGLGHHLMTGKIIVRE